MKISKPEKVSDCEKESEEEEKCDGDAEEEVAKDPGNQLGESRAGRLRARRKQSGHKPSGLIQVRLQRMLCFGLCYFPIILFSCKDTSSTLFSQAEQRRTKRLS